MDRSCEGDCGLDGVDRQISLTVVELAVGNTEAAHAYALRAEEDAGNSGCNEASVGTTPRLTIQTRSAVE